MKWTLGFQCQTFTGELSSQHLEEPWDVVKAFFALAFVGFLAAGYSILGMVQSASFAEAGDYKSIASFHFWKWVCIAANVITLGALALAVRQLRLSKR